MTHQAVNKTYWYILAPIIIAEVGFPLNLFIETSISMFIAIIFITIYDKTKKDWLLLESLKATQENLSLSKNKKQNSVTRRIAYWAKKDKYLLFFALISWDPTFSCLYFREGNHKWNGIPLKTIPILIISSFIPNLIWTIVISGILFVIT